MHQSQSQSIQTARKADAPTWRCRSAQPTPLERHDVRTVDKGVRLDPATTVRLGPLDAEAR
jgi:hypothetical protein